MTDAALARVAFAGAKTGAFLAHATAILYYALLFGGAAAFYTHAAFAFTFTGALVGISVARIWNLRRAQTVSP